MILLILGIPMTTSWPLLIAGSPFLMLSIKTTMRSHRTNAQELPLYPTLCLTIQENHISELSNLNSFKLSKK